MQLSIIIVNYNVKFFLEQCLCSVLKACVNIKAEIIVVDNNSTDGSRDFFSNRFETVKFIWSNINAGFAKANNEGLKIATGEKILFLNPDTILPEDCLEMCLQYYSDRKNIGALGVKMIDGSGNFLPESKRGFPSAATSFFKMTGLIKLLPRSTIAARYYLGHLPNDKINVADVISGAFMMVDKKVIDNVGSFDEDYFMYAEDIDLSYRIQKSGYQNIYFADTTIIHFKGESTIKQSVEYVKNFYGTMILFVEKHYGKLTGNFYILMLKMLIHLKLFGVPASSRSKNQSKGNDSIAVIADKKTYESIKSSLENQFKNIELKKEIDFLIDKGSAILFCLPPFSFKKLIQSMQELNAHHIFLIHSAGTQSIIGSTDKNQSGIAINLESIKADTAIDK